MKPTARALLLLLALGAGCSGAVQPEDLSDPAIKAKVESVLRGREDIDLKYVSVDVNGGVVTLSGIVPSGEQRRLADRLVRRIRGVDQLLNNLAVQD